MLLRNLDFSSTLFPMVGFIAAVFFVAVDPVDAASPAGRWRGEWTSRSTGHHGPMRANVRPNGDGSYSARFSGRFFVVFPFTYRVDLVPTGWGGYSAEKKLGPIMGSYRMQTQFGTGAMSGSFQAAKDVGTVSMQRVGH